jgi:chemotaxis protein MotB
MSEKKAPPPEESGEKVPLWIISFADMITLLMSFFVMLQTMANHQDAALMGVSRESFRRAIAGFGMPDLLYGSPSELSFDYRKLKYPTESADEPQKNPERVIDADDEEIRRVFKEVRSRIDTNSTNTNETLVNLIRLPIEFDSGQAELTAAAREALQVQAEHFASELKPAVHRLYVIGFAPEELEGGQRWILSAIRAKRVEQFLLETLSSRSGAKWTTTCWGSGPPRTNGKDTSAAQRTFVVIAVMGAKNNG